MTLASLPVWMVGAVTGYVGLSHLALFVRRRKPVDLIFGITCLLVTAFDVATALLYSERNPMVALEYHRVQIAMILASGGFFLSFMEHASGVKEARWGGRIVPIFVGLGVFALVDRDGWMLTSEMTMRELPGIFEPVRLFEARVGPLFLPIAAVIPLMFCYVFYLSWVSHKQTRQWERSLSLLASGTLILTGILNDNLVADGVYRGPYVAEYSWFALILLMSWGVSQELVGARTTKAALAEVEARMKAVLDAIADAVISTDLAGLVTHANPAAQKLLGGSPLGFPLRELIELTDPDNGDIVGDPIRYALSRAPNPYANLPRLVTRAGYDLRADLGGAPLKDAAGRTRGAVVIIRDLTIQQTAIESLQHTQQMQAVGQLAGGIAHDLNNLLTPIVAYAELTARTVEPASKAGKFAEQIVEAARRAASLTQKLLALSRKQVLDVQVVSVNSLLAHISPLLEGLLPEGMTLQLELDSAAGNVRVDSGQLEQVLLNLVSNARDASQPDGIITVTTRRLGEAETSIQVKDEGAGMPHSVQNRIFEPFFTTKARGQGTGLGLASVRGIVEQHGGHIFVDSEPGHGSSFDIILPVEELTAVAPGIPSSEATARMPRGSENILVVEDDPAVRDSLAASLVQLGYHVTVADGLAQAVHAAESQKYDLVISDIVMPGVDGTIVVEELQKQYPVPPLFMTGHADDRLGARGFLPQGTDLLRKPFTLTELATTVRSVLDRPRPDEPAPLD